MTIGIPRALHYHRHGPLWEAFLAELDIPYVVSDETNQKLLNDGQKHTVDESCLPLKLYMGHAASLLDRCNRLLVPRFVRLGRRDEFCVRFWGLADTVVATFEGVELLTYQLKSKNPGMEEWLGFLHMGNRLGKNPAASWRAYRIAKSRAEEADFRRFAQNRSLLRARAPKILLAAQPYISYDPFLGGTVARLIRTLGGVPLFAEGWNRTACQKAGAEIAPGLYWTLNREILGAIHLAENQVDGVILLTAFPCGSDALVNELILRRMRGLPIIQILLDEHQSQEGLMTRLESFLDMIAQRRRAI